MHGCIGEVKKSIISAVNEIILVQFLQILTAFYHLPMKLVQSTLACRWFGICLRWIKLHS